MQTLTETTIQVKNASKTRLTFPYDVYCGRYSRYRKDLKESPLSNPFKLEKESDRETVIKRYAEWLALNKNQYRIKNELQRLTDLWHEYGKLHLYCWCSPKSCHCDVIKEVLINDFI